MHTLQSLVFPNFEVSNEEAMYLRVSGRAWIELGTGCAHFEPGGLMSTDTFYNGLTVGAWKGRCDVQSLAFELCGEGRCVVSFGLHRLGMGSVWIAEASVELQPGSRTTIPVDAWPVLHDGLLFVRIRALGPARLDAARWATADAPLHDIRLGIVVTHFNRLRQVVPAIERLCRFIDRRPDLLPRLTVTVVDNSRNLPLSDDGPLTVIPNRNLGGTGGFVRGLLALMDRGDHTHALFMDDDASCEVDAVARCVALLQYARDPAQAVAGALLREAAPWHLVEKGARFDGQVRQMGSGMDMRRIDALLQAERSTTAPDYGAWWFFAFPLSAVRRFPFPFFVRGDDILFGLSNRFRIMTMNGIACYGEDFSAKHGPLSAYLDARYHLVLALLGERQVAKRLRWATRLFVKAISSYHYSSARAVTLAVRHVLQGPEVFREQLDLQAVRSEIGAWTPDEKLRPLDIAAYTTRPARRERESRARRLVRLLTLQGFLLPDALLKPRMTVQDKAFHGRASSVFRYRQVLYHHAPTGTGYIAEYDRRRFFAELRAFAVAFAALMRRRGALQREYAAAAEQLMTMAFWRSVYGDAPAPTPPAPQEATAALVAD